MRTCSGVCNCRETHSPVCQRNVLSKDQDGNISSLRTAFRINLPSLRSRRAETLCASRKMAKAGEAPQGSHFLFARSAIASSKWINVPVYSHFISTFILNYRNFLGLSPAPKETPSPAISPLPVWILMCSISRAVPLLA